MHQKVTENSAGATAGGGSATALADSFDPTQITQAFDDFIAKATATLKQDPGDDGYRLVQQFEAGRLRPKVINLPG